ncbi:MAG: hypothetical protein ACM3SY_06060 [Candidatus Omnitrophota bacterium]
MKINPYIAGNSVGGGDAFIGREKILCQIVNRLEQPGANVFVIYGQRRIGKTSILQELDIHLPKDGRYCTVYFDLMDKNENSLPEVLTDLAYAIANRLGATPPDLRIEPETYFSEIWLPSIFSLLPDDVSIVLLIDEFDTLTPSLEDTSNTAAKAFFPYLRRLFNSYPLRLQFVIAIGRNINDLSNSFMALFKGAEACQISLLEEQETDNLIGLSEVNGTLKWSREAKKRVRELTSGHPLFTQMLCRIVWFNIYERDTGKKDKLPTVTNRDVDLAVGDTLGACHNWMEWLWDGLSAAQRIVICGLSKAGPKKISQAELEDLLARIGIKILIPELQDAVQRCKEWDLIEEVKGNAPKYRFRVELLRRWVEKFKTLRQVQEQFDRIDPLADSYYRIAMNHFENDQREKALSQVQEALRLNPNHIKAGILCARIEILLGNIDIAGQRLKKLYDLRPDDARPLLIQVWITQADQALNEDKKLEFYKAILEIDSKNADALLEYRLIWKRRGNAALEKNDLDRALEAFETLGDSDKVYEIRLEILRRKLEEETRQLDVFFDEKQYNRLNEWLKTFDSRNEDENARKFLRKIVMERSGKKISSILGELQQETPGIQEVLLLPRDAAPISVTFNKEAAQTIADSTIILLNELESSQIFSEKESLNSFWISGDSFIFVGQKISDKVVILALFHADANLGLMSSFVKKTSAEEICCLLDIRRNL